jgi:hypothetical protein
LNANMNLSPFDMRTPESSPGAGGNDGWATSLPRREVAGKRRKEQPRPDSIRSCGLSLGSPGLFKEAGGESGHGILQIGFNWQIKWLRFPEARKCLHGNGMSLHNWDYCNIKESKTQYNYAGEKKSFTFHGRMILETDGGTLWAEAVEGRQEVLNT